MHAQSLKPKERETPRRQDVAANEQDNRNAVLPRVAVLKSRPHLSKAIHEMKLTSALETPQASQQQSINTAFNSITEHNCDEQTLPLFHGQQQMVAFRGMGTQAREGFFSEQPSLVEEEHRMANAAPVSSRNMLRGKEELIKEEMTYESERSSIFNEGLDEGNTNKEVPREGRAPQSANQELLSSARIGNGAAVVLTSEGDFETQQKYMGDRSIVRVPTHEGVRKNQLFIELTLRHQGLEKLSEKMLEKGSSLRTIDIRNNKLRKLPEYLCDLPILWKLRVDFNLLESLPENIGRLQKLEVLTASQNALKLLPKSLYAMT